ncbi:NAD(P)-binding protein [Patellaria atrata CBS 101060]|uniref:NAD(P)-binding protein n=1 Tax=Patellaria atrata CBS 101060 TaxID=1346257 RepID=A0A9P4VSP6_9PEZI|nr:NAD(P)-binding protein [Patellaria atrata CBS 101060]
MSRPNLGRIASTNLTSGVGSRILEGKVAIVTGASRGIGAAICRNLAGKGCSLVMNYTSDSSAEPATKLAEELQESEGIKAITVQADMGSETGPAHVVEIARNHFAHPKTGKFVIDIIVNNAGVAKNQAIEDVTIDAFSKLYNVNVRGPLLLMKAATQYLPTDRSGRIVNISSVSARLGYATQSIYGGTKAALEAMTRTWARELAERATVNAINPGPVATDMYEKTDEAFVKQNAPHIKNGPLTAPRQGVDPQKYVDAAPVTGGRPAYDFEIAGAVGMLVLPEAAWTTGSVVCANGGMVFSL